MRALVIGGGPGGSVAAILLARGGWDVTIIEQHRFPRDKVCGECLSPLALAVMTRVGMLERARALRPAVMRLARFLTPDGAAVVVKLPGTMWGLSRSALDVLLLDCARAAGACIRQPARCESIDRVVTVRDLCSNELSTIEYDKLILADGKAALAVGRPEASGDLGLKAHYQGVDAPSDTIGLYSLPGHYCGLAPIENRRWNVAMSVPAERVRACAGDFDRLLSPNAGLRAALSRARRITPWLASPLPRFGVTNHWPANVIPVGNAAAALEPIGGEGIGLAMRSAELAAESLLRGDGDATALADTYQRLWRTRSLVCRLGAMALSQPDIADAAAPLISANPALAGLLFDLTGKAQPVQSSP
jgi:menaquinone-9 beta-reductase